MEAQHARVRGSATVSGLYKYLAVSKWNAAIRTEISQSARVLMILSIQLSKIRVLRGHPGGPARVHLREHVMQSLESSDVVEETSPGHPSIIH